MAHIIRCDGCGKEFADDAEMMYKVTAPAIRTMGEPEEEQFCSKACIATRYNKLSGLGLVAEPKASCDID